MTLPELRDTLVAKPLVKLSCAEAVVLVDFMLATHAEVLAARLEIEFLSHKLLTGSQP